MVYILFNFENSENRYKGGDKSPMSGYQGQSKDARFTMKLQY